jgi:Cu/Ag efflux protein CusF
MIQLTLTGIAMLTGLGALLTASPEPPIAPPQVREISSSETTTVKATIVKIDKATRAVTLRGEKGNDVTVIADQNVQRFNELKIGDVVTAVYTQALAISIRKPGAPAPPAQSETVVREKDNLGATVTKQRTVSVSVQAIDIPNVKLSVKDSNGITSTFKVKDVNQLKELKIGDKVDVTYTDGLMMRADRAQ